jgi:Xaa-Pro aminopeptidase
MKRRACLIGLSVLLGADLLAQPVFRGSEIFPPEEFAARRGAVAAALGDGVAIVLGTTEPAGEMPFRQNSQFFYLTGVAEARASVIIDGRTKKTTVFLQPRTAKQDTSRDGPGLGPGPETAAAIGVDAVLPRAEFTAAITAIAKDHRTIYTPFEAGVLGSQSQGDPTHLWTANAQDPWDGRDSREATLGASYFALIATGTNTYYTHYNRNTATLADGDLVQFDYAPDFKYYQSDVTRLSGQRTVQPQAARGLRDLLASLSGRHVID